MLIIRTTKGADDGSKRALEPASTAVLLMPSVEDDNSLHFEQHGVKTEPGNGHESLCGHMTAEHLQGASGQHVQLGHVPQPWLRLAAGDAGPI